MAVDMRARYFGAPEEFFMPDEGMMMPSFSAFPQGMPQPSAFGAMPMSGAAPIMGTPREAAVMPMTQEAAPFDLSSLAGLDLSGLGGFGGGRMGGVIQDPNIQYITAPVSNKGNPTGKMGGNVFAVTPDQPVRLVDHRTNQVVFEGSGYDAARKATELGQGLTDQFGRKANYSIQTADPTGAYNTVAYEKKNKSTLGKIADVAGTVAPIALSFVPGFQGLSLGLKMAAAAGAGGLGAALKGDNILKGALLGGATAGIASGTGLDKALGGALGNIGKGAVTAGGQAAADATGDIVVTALSKLAQGAGGAAANTLLSQGLKGGLSEVTGYKTPAERFADQPSSIADPVAPYDGLTVTGPKLVSGSGSPFGAAVSIPVNEMLSGALTAAQPTPTEQPKTAEDIEAERNPMVVTGGGLETLTPDELLTALAALGGAGGIAAATAGGGAGASSTAATQAEDDIIKVTGRLPTKTPPLIPGFETAMPAITAGALTAAQMGGAPNDNLTAKEIADYLRLAGLAVGVVGGGGGGGGGGGAAGSQAINPIFSAKLPTPGVGGAFKVGGLDYTTPPARSAADMYRYAMGPAMDIPAGMDLSRATSPYAGYGPGTLGEETFRRVAEGGTFVMPDQLRTPAPITTPIPNEPAGPSMYAPDVDNMRFAQGGAFAAKRGGSSRDSFAVNGPGTGRSDDIPAVLSDGEYVIDAETVALLGDGSSKAGAKKLDEMRVKLRKHKGRNLAKGKFSVNAKRPEKYLSGGRT
jgi:hypothetical protein